MLLLTGRCIFFFNQKTAYEMRISDWSSDVCSSDLVTRPAAQADALCGLLEARAATVLRLPLHSIEPLRQPAAAARTLAQMRNADAWIFTSVNAVAHAQRLDAGVWPRTIAVGAATAAALRRLDHEVELPDGAYTSEGVQIGRAH